VTKNSTVLYLLILGLLLIIAAAWYLFALGSQPQVLPSPTEAMPIFTSTALPTIPQPSQTPPVTITPVPVSFDGQHAYASVEAQVAMGPRVPGTEGHTKVQAWIGEELAKSGWQVEVQESEALGHPIENIVAKRSDAPPQIIIGAHYDSRMYADNDPDPAQHTNFVPGANDGASGVAVLLELGRSLPQETVPIWLVFFDAEDNGSIEGWDWILGSREFVKNNPVRPHAVIVVDMIGDADLNIYKEGYSNPELTDGIWKVAAELGYVSKFIPEYKHSMIDDHRPFLDEGIAAVDIIDFDYPYWHTIQDTPDKVSPESLQVVGETLRVWVMQQTAQP
jgi:Zn-dependent M28 family amino/carboxypeptidase